MLRPLADALRAVGGRSLAVLVQLLVLIDMAAQTIWDGALYLLFLRPTCPDAHETISSVLGRAREDGRWSGSLFAPVVDALFWLLGQGWGHCARNVMTATYGLPPVP